MSARDVIAGEVSAGCNTVDWERGRTDSEEVADAILSALDKAGYAVVPQEPTEKMFFQSWRSVKDDHSGFINVGVLRTLYAAMLTAAKETP